MKILKNLLKTFTLFSFKNDLDVEDDVSKRNSIPNDFSEYEKIARTVFSPFNFKKNKQQINTKEVLNKNVFETPPERDEVSVNRLNYTTSNHIKKIGKIIESPDGGNRNYCGVAIIDVSEILSADAFIVYTPNDITYDRGKKFPNPYHSDIKIGCIKEKGKALDQRFVYKVSKMLISCRYYPDPNPQEDNWNGPELT